MGRKVKIFNCMILLTFSVFGMLRSGRAAGQVVDIQATNLQRGDAVALPAYGEPLSIGGKWAEYDFEISEEGNYVLSAGYASGESRPVSVFLDGSLVTGKGMATSTGSYNTATGIWEDLGIVELSAGKHTLKIQTSYVSPHIFAFKLIHEQAGVVTPAFRGKSESLKNRFREIKTALQPFQNTAEGTQLSGELAALENDLTRAGINVPGPVAALEKLDTLEKQANDLQVVLAGFITERLAGSKDDVVLWASNPLTKIFKDSLLPLKANTQGVFIEALRNEYEPAQVCISSYDFQGPVRVRVNPLVHLSGKYKFSDINARFVGFIARASKGTPESQSVLDASIGYPDPLMLDEEVILKPRQTQPVWITVKVPKDALPGEYKGDIEVITKAGNATLPLHLTVYPVTLPEITNFWMGAWGGDTILAEEFGIIEKGEWNKGNYPPEYFDFLKNEAVRNRREHRNMVFSDQPLWTPLQIIGIFLREEGGYIYDYTLFDKLVSTIEEGFGGHFRIICCGIADEITKGKKGLFSGQIKVLNPDGSVNPERSFSNISTDDPRYLEFIGNFFKAMSLHLREKGWLDNVYFKVIDEPLKEYVAATLRLNEHIKQKAPGIRLNTTFHQEATFEPMAKAEYVDLGIAMWNSSPVQEEIKKGREFWLYNDPTFVINQPLIHIRKKGWVSYAEGLKGYMHWAWCWKRNPWEDNFDQFGFGGHFIVYPDKARKKVLDSLRWEMLRETAEDYDTLVLLEKLGGDSRKFAQMIKDLDTSPEADPERFSQVRHQLLLELNRLSQ